MSERNVDYLMVGSFCRDKYNDHYLNTEDINPLIKGYN